MLFRYLWIVCLFLYHICTTRGTRQKTVTAIADTFTSFYKDLHRLTLFSHEDSFTKVFKEIIRRKWERQHIPTPNNTSLSQRPLNSLVFHVRLTIYARLNSGALPYNQVSSRTIRIPIAALTSIQADTHPTKKNGHLTAHDLRNYITREEVQQTYNIEKSKFHKVLQRAKALKQSATATTLTFIDIKQKNNQKCRTAFSENC